ncbi:MAG: DMT family transporter [Candidatus Reddybacter sp.]
MNNSLFYALLMLLAGLGIPVMATLNGALGTRLQSPALAATILFSVGLIIAAIYLVVIEDVPVELYRPSTPLYLYFGGFFVMFYILSITWVAPRFGVSNAVSFVLLGQLVAMSVIDHYGLIGVLKYPINMQRLAGLVLMTAGVFLVVSRAPEGS